MATKTTTTRHDETQNSSRSPTVSSCSPEIFIARHTSALVNNSERPLSCSQPLGCQFAGRQALARSGWLDRCGCAAVWRQIEIKIGIENETRVGIQESSFFSNNSRLDLCLN
jgi:hypothetical protein